MSENKEEDETVPHDIVFPAVTDDYRVAKVNHGVGLVANRRIKKGQPIMSDSFEYQFGDVQEGDRLLFTQKLRKHKAAAKKKGTGNKQDDLLPTHYPLTREILLHTHGVPAIDHDLSTDENVVISWHLEVPGMLCNHSCDPNILVDSDGEDYAAHDIEIGDELTVDYCREFYNVGALFSPCLCGMEKCRGAMMGFASLSAAQKEEMLPRLNDSVKAMYLADIGEGPKVTIRLNSFPPRICKPVVPMLLPPLASSAPTSSSSETTPMRIVFPGPSWANVIVKKFHGAGDGGDIEGDEDKYALYASKDVAKGEMFYEFWWEEWPQGGNAMIDMAFSSKEHKDDPPEGTVIRFDPRKTAAYRTASGTLMFSGWQLLTTHSGSPNLVYRNKDKYEDNDWQCVFAAQDIKKGDLITMDRNCFIWDQECTSMGFKHLSPEAQQELKNMTWLHELDPVVSTTSYASEAPLPCRALSPFVRASLLKEEALGFGTKKIDLDYKSTSSFSSSDDDDADDDSSSSSEEDSEQL